MKREETRHVSKRLLCRGKRRLRGHPPHEVSDHRTRRPEFQSTDNEDTAWWIGHWVCVIAAWLGLLLLLTVLAVPAFTDHEGGARWVTGAAAVIAATILALDVAIPSQQERR